MVSGRPADRLHGRGAGPRAPLRDEPRRHDRPGPHLRSARRSLPVLVARWKAARLHERPRWCAGDLCPVRRWRQGTRGTWDRRELGAAGASAADDRAGCRPDRQCRDRGGGRARPAAGNPSGTGLAAAGSVEYSDRLDGRHQGRRHWTVARYGVGRSALRHRRDSGRRALYPVTVKRRCHADAAGRQRAASGQSQRLRSAPGCRRSSGSAPPPTETPTTETTPLCHDRHAPGQGRRMRDGVDDRGPARRHACHRHERRRARR